MWFKNLQVYRFTKPFVLSPEQLAEQLQEKPFQPCGGQDVFRYGWVPPLGHYGTDFVHANSGYIMLCAKKQEKVLPAAVVNEYLLEKVEAIQDAEGRSVGRKERSSLKDEITFDLLPRAFTRSSLQFAYIAVREGLLVVNAASSKRAEELLSHLRETIGSVPVIPVAANNTPQQVMTHWLQQGQPPAGFEFGHECELRDPSDEAGVIRCKHQQLTSAEITNHIKTGMYVSKLGLCWNGGVEFMVDDQLAVKRLNFSELLEDKGGQLDAEDAAAQFDVDFTIMTQELSKLHKALIDVFGGEQVADDPVINAV